MFGAHSFESISELSDSLKLVTLDEKMNSAAVELVAKLGAVERIGELMVEFSLSGGRPEVFFRDTEFSRKAEAQGDVYCIPYSGNNHLQPIAEHCKSWFGGGVVLQQNCDRVGFSRLVLHSQPAASHSCCNSR